MNLNATNGSDDRPHVVVIGGGFAGLAAAWELTRHGVRPTVLEADAEVGGLAGSFEVNGERLEKFYHHWFTNDAQIGDLVKELGAEDRVLYRPTRTGMYFAKNFFKLSSPVDVLRFTPLSFANRIRLGLLALRARAVRDWKELESLTAEEWLVKLGGRQVYRVVWEPLLHGKFGPFASQISAVWFWNKLKLRGGSRGKGGAEMLAYYRGGFAALAEQLASEVVAAGGQVRTGVAATGLVVEHGRVTGVETSEGEITADAVIATPALPIFADLVEPHVSADYVDDLRKVEYLANVCLVLELDRSLSETYWLNVNDPGFPFVGVIEHTNFEPAETYGGRHIVYLSKYLPETAELYQMGDAEVLEYCIPYLQRMFPEFDRSWILGSHVWRARYSQPIVARHYSNLIPSTETPVEGLYLATMAQIYPEDRGTNYAIREGRRVARTVAAALGQREQIEQTANGAARNA
jgi:protoporphyrinogen oxidase